MADGKVSRAFLEQSIPPLSQTVSRSYSQDPTDTYSSIPSSHAYPPQGRTNSNSLYAYGSPQSSMLSTYGESPRTNTSNYGDGLDSLSRQNSRSDTYELYPGSDRPSAGCMYASSAGTEPIPIPSQRRPSTFSDASESSFDSMYGFKYCKSVELTWPSFD
jgi:hypothetical protein